MKIINVSLKINPAKRSEYEAFIDKLVQGSRSEAGNVSYGHYKKLGADDEYEIIEHWKDQAAVDSHNETPHFKEFLDHIGDYLAEDLEIIRMDN
ncbi:putative quinol monooxygenase [Companilactobacillus zhongbaensis]|uniref:putative quinol monooxygenase n=1 Tax=Companilactobacillus zhongbaensis TaxID=2486009 RepID=UPI000F789EF5|nr:putative quinol monooxygenase [Companilactobacillus zhongbaensis]